MVTDVHLVDGEATSVVPRVLHLQVTDPSVTIHGALLLLVV